MNTASSSLSSVDTRHPTIELADLYDSAESGFEHEPATRLLFEGLEEGVLLMERSRIAYANPAAAALLHTDVATLSGRLLGDWISEAKHEDLYRHLHAADGEGTTQRSLLCRFDGQMLGVDIQCVRLRGLPGRHMLFLRPNRAQSPGNEPSAHLPLDLLPFGVLHVDGSLRYLYGNSALAQIAPYFAQARHGSHVGTLGWPSAFCAALKETLARMEGEPCMQRVLLPFDDDGTALGWWAQAVPACDEKGQVQTISFLFDVPCSRETNIDADRNPEQELSEKNRYNEAIAAVRARDAFFGWVSHELRTPMNGIQSWAHILETYVNASSASPLAQRALQGIRHGITQQLQLVDELLDVSRIIEGRINPAKQPFNLRPTLQAAIDSLRAEAQPRAIQFACHYTLARERVSGDPCRVQQMIRLLLNYLLHSVEDGSTLHLYVRSVGSQVVVALHGAGGMIPADPVRSRHTSRTLKAARSCRRELDVYLVRRLAELQGGRLEDGLPRMAQCDAESQDKLKAGLQISQQAAAFTLLMPQHIHGRKRARTA